MKKKKVSGKSLLFCAEPPCGSAFEQVEKYERHLSENHGYAIQSSAKMMGMLFNRPFHSQDESFIFFASSENFGDERAVFENGQFWPNLPKFRIMTSQKGLNLTKWIIPLNLSPQNCLEYIFSAFMYA